VLRKWLVEKSANEYVFYTQQFLQTYRRTIVITLGSIVNFALASVTFQKTYTPRDYPVWNPGSVGGRLTSGKSKLRGNSCQVTVLTFVWRSTSYTKRVGTVCYAAETS
jgi:hypothetical protein